MLAAAGARRRRAIVCASMPTWSTSTSRTIPHEFTLHGRRAEPRSPHRRRLGHVRVGRQRTELRRPSTAIGAPAIVPAFRTSYASARCSTRSTRSPASRSNRSTSTRRSVTSKPPTTPTPSPTSRSTSTRSAGSATSTASRWRASRAGSITTPFDARAEPHVDHQRVVAAALRPSDARGHHPDVGAQPGDHHHAVHARGCDGADHARRRHRAAERRGTGRARHSPRSCAGAHRRCTAGSRRTSTCARARRRSAHRSTPRRA